MCFGEKKLGTGLSRSRDVQLDLVGSCENPLGQRTGFYTNYFEVRLEFLRASFVGKYYETLNKDYRDC
jgi:hypothetical protein